MKRDLKCVDRLLSFAAKHPQFKIAAIIVTAVILFVCHLSDAVKRHRRQIVAMTSVFVITGSIAAVIVCVPKTAIADDSVLYENRIENEAIYAANMPYSDEQLVELVDSSEQAQTVPDFGLSMDDFLAEGEALAGYEDIRSFLANELPGQDISTGMPIIEINDESNETIQAADAVEASGSSVDTASLMEDCNFEVEGIESDDIMGDDDWSLILVNKQNPIPEGYDAHLVNISGSMMADSRITEDLARMFEAARCDGITLMICSAYRSADRQQNLFDNKINKCLAKGLNYLDAYSEASMSVTIPGMSEHQLGLALDIVTDNYMNLDDGFGETDAGIWLRNNAPDYGFILRYPKDKEEITGIIYEPWHFRYVGKDYSRKITDMGLTLEEFRAMYISR